MTNQITIEGRLASFEADGPLVAGNTYPVAVSYDEEWSGTVYLRVRFGSLYYDIPMTIADGASSADVQLPVGYPEVGLGVYSEALEICTNEARAKVVRSILEAGEEVVSFDGDLYDQWAGEVTALVTDDAFDAESTKPVQNAVITAWKGQVEGGAMTVGGAKTFTSPVGVGTPTASGHAVDLGTLATKLADGSVTKVGTSDVGTDAKPVKIVAGVPTAVGADLATDSAVVHKTGSETIAGAKTFSDTLNITQTNANGLVTYSNFDLATAGKIIGMAFRNGSPEADIAYIDVYSEPTTHRLFFRLKAFSAVDRNGAEFKIEAYDSVDGVNVSRMTGPYYLPVNADEEPVAPPNPTVMASANVAVDPRIVHTTGAETIAGNKTYTGQANLQGATQVTGAWANKPAAVPRASLGWHRVLEYVQPTSGTTNRQAIWLMSTQGMLDSQTGGVLDAVGILAMSCSGNSAQAVWLAGSKVRPEDAVMVKDWSGGKWRWTLWVNQVHTNEGRMVERLSERSSTGLANSFAVCGDIATAYASLPEAHTPGQGEDPSTEVKVVASVIGSMT